MCVQPSGKFRRILQEFLPEIGPTPKNPFQNFKVIFRIPLASYFLSRRMSPEPRPGYWDIQTSFKEIVCRNGVRLVYMQ